jgi:hypothetical protein
MCVHMTHVELSQVDTHTSHWWSIRNFVVLSRCGQVMARCWFRAHSLVADVSVDDCLRSCRGILAMISRELYWSLHMLKWRFELLDLSSGRCVNLLCDIRALVTRVVCCVSTERLVRSPFVQVSLSWTLRCLCGHRSDVCFCFSIFLTHLSVYFLSVLVPPWRLIQVHRLVLCAWPDEAPPVLCYAVDTGHWSLYSHALLNFFCSLCFGFRYFLKPASLSGLLFCLFCVRVVCFLFHSYARVLFMLADDGLRCMLHPVFLSSVRMVGAK